MEEAIKLAGMFIDSGPISIIVDSILNTIFDINKSFHSQIWTNLSELYCYNITRTVFMVFRLFLRLTALLAAIRN